MKKLKFSLITMLLVVILFATTTFAWISLATVNRIQDISLNAISGSDLEISLDGINYYDTIPKDLILQKIKDLKFKDVTSQDGITFQKHFTSLEQAIPNKEYLSLDFHFRTTSSYREIHLSDNTQTTFDSNNVNGTYIVSKGVNWKANFDFLYGKNEIVKKDEVRTYYAHDAMRVSFHNYFDQTTKIFDLSGDEERGFGKKYGALNYYNLSKGEKITPPKAPDTIYELSKFSSEEPYALTDSSHIITLQKSDNIAPNNKPYYEGKVQMNVWLEGWDADCFDAIYSDHLKMQFMFRAVLPKLK